MTEPASATTPIAANPFSATDVEMILRERGWLGEAAAGATGYPQWTVLAALLLGAQSSTREELAELLRLVWEYDAAGILRRADSQAVLTRDGAREVLRALASLVLEGSAVDSDRYKEIITALKTALPYRGRRLFFPVRLALAGRAGEGQLDRVILLLDSAAALPFAARVKGTRERIIEFLAALE